MLRWSDVGCKHIYNDHILLMSLPLYYYFHYIMTFFVSYYSL